MFVQLSNIVGYYSDTDWPTADAVFT